MFGAYMDRLTTGLGGFAPSLRRPTRPHIVIPGLVPGIHAAVRRQRWREIPGTSPSMTEGALRYDGRNVVGLPRQPIFVISSCFVCARRISSCPFGHEGRPSTNSASFAWLRAGLSRTAIRGPGRVVSRPAAGSFAPWDPASRIMRARPPARVSRRRARGAGCVAPGRFLRICHEMSCSPCLP